eukprot:gene25553-11201_t
MTELSSLHAQAKHLILSLRSGLDKLEAAEHGQNASDPGGLARDLRLKLADLQGHSKNVLKWKVEQVSEEVDSIRHTLDKYGTREQRRQAEVTEREELFARADQGRKAKAEMDEESQVIGSVTRSKRALEEIYESGANILTNMVGNRERLKKAHRKILDVLNSGEDEEEDEGKDDEEDGVESEVEDKGEEEGEEEDGGDAEDDEDEEDEGAEKDEEEGEVEDEGEEEDDE